MSKLNLPNKLTVSRLIAVPFCMAAIMITPPDSAVNFDLWQRIIAALLFALISLTDMLDGMIARKRGLITDFGKFLDPLADKFLVIGCYLSLILKCRDMDKVFPVVLVLATTVVVMRELAVTSLRLLVSNSSGEVIAAGILGKIKTVSQIVSIMTVLLEPVIFGATTNNILSYITISFMAVMTVWSGIDYCCKYWRFLSANK